MDKLPSDIQIINAKEFNVFVRPDTTDEFIVKEVLESNTYRKLHILPTDVVMDFGMNIGMFTIRALNQGATVYAYEPEHENFIIAQANVEASGLDAKAHLFEVAVTGDNRKVREFSINLKRNKGAHSLVAKRGRDTIKVKAENINDIFAKYKPTVIKMDIEGGEYECIKAIKDYSGIREFILEFHHAHLLDVDSHKKHFEILDILRKNFKTVEAREKTKKAWVTLVYASVV